MTERERDNEPSSLELSFEDCLVSPLQIEEKIVNQRERREEKTYVSWYFYCDENEYL